MKFKDLTITQKIIYINISIFLVILHILLFAILNKYLSLLWSIIILFIPYIIILILIWWNNLSFKKLFINNLFIFGVKGAGKDLLMQSGIYFNRKNYKFLSNMDFGYSCTKIDDLTEVFSLGNNTFRTLVDGKPEIIEKKEFMEGKVFVLSDASIYFPSHEDTALKKQYPSYPLFYAISRHLYNMPFIVNTQVNGRLWKSLREQVQDGYVQALYTLGKRESFLWNSIPILNKYLFVKYRYYEKEESAVNGLLPFRKIAIVNKISDKTVYMTSAGATQEQYNAAHGKIKEGFVIINKKHIKYDNRHFHKLFFGEQSPTTRKEDNEC